MQENPAGPISVAIHIQDDESHEEILAELHDLYRTNPLMKEYVDLHLIVDKFDRQFNMWRNVAKFFARTEYIVMLGNESRSLQATRDSSFAKCPGYFSFIFHQMSTSIFVQTFENPFAKILPSWISFALAPLHW